MSKAAFTVRAFGYYLLALGAVLILIPNVLLAMTFMPPTSEVWIRVVGVLVFNIGVYYIYAARCEATAVFRASVYARTFVLVAFAAFAVLGLAEPVLVVFGAVDFVGGLWTWKALQNGGGA
ncbi:MAG: hypothetical protein U1F58_08540 [Burkholderiales bacterium]